MLIILVLLFKGTDERNLKMSPQDILKIVLQAINARAVGPTFKKSLRLVPKILVPMGILLSILFPKGFCVIPKPKTPILKSRFGV